LGGAGARAQSADNPDITTRAGRRVNLPVAEEIALARSAAPVAISVDATVMMLTDSGYTVAEKGKSSVTCVVNRSWTHALEPHCYDEEGARTVMLIELRRNFLRHRGISETEIEADIGRGLLAGKFRLPTRPALSYMMSAAQILYDDKGKLVGKWRPHLMIYFPYMTTQSLGFREQPEMTVGMVSESGEPSSSLVILMPRFAESASARSP
jgi:hypothetical protein